MLVLNLSHDFFYSSFHKSFYKAVFPFFLFFCCATLNVLSTKKQCYDANVSDDIKHILHSFPLFDVCLQRFVCIILFWWRGFVAKKVKWYDERAECLWEKLWKILMNLFFLPPSSAGNFRFSINISDVVKICGRFKFLRVYDAIGERNKSSKFTVLNIYCFAIWFYCRCYVSACCGSLRNNLNNLEKGQSHDEYWFNEYDNRESINMKSDIRQTFDNCGIEWKWKSNILTKKSPTSEEKNAKLWAWKLQNLFRWINIHHTEKKKCALRSCI